ncbi:MAG: hypothetical protein Q4E35_02720 [Eubacteriales bacterium]|nr:hypothetical protein [Eubacteriales bacterium]
MKKFITMLTLLMLIFALCGCGAKIKDEAKPIGMPNPMTEVTAQELLDKQGFTFELPEGAEDVHYFTIDGEQVISQMTFVLDGKKVCCRIMPDGIPENREVKDISGMYYDWKVTENGKVFYNDAVFRLNEGEQGWVGWYDYVPGLLYNVSMDSGASVEALTLLAETCNHPVQGDVG